MSSHEKAAFGQTAQVFIGRVRYDLYAESYMGGLVTDREFIDGHSRATGPGRGSRPRHLLPAGRPSPVSD